MTALYLIAAEYRNDAAALSDLDLDEQTVADTLEGMAGALEAKAENVALFARNLEVTAAAMRDAEVAMAARRKAVEARVSRLRAYMLACMQTAGVHKISTAQMQIAVRDNPPAVEVFDAAQVPAQFMRTPEPPPPSPDKTAIKDAIKAGEEVPGARLTQSQRLEIK